MFTRDELVTAHDRFMAMSQAAQESGEWERYCDLFTEDALYIEHFVGTFHGRDEIKAWFIPAMTTWSQMSFPLRWRTFDEEHGLVVFGVGNDLPDVEGHDPFTVESWSLLEYAGNGQWCREEDIYNPDAMLKMLSGWCDASGIPFPGA